MLTGELRSQIDAIWNSFWSGGISNPLVVMEQITYLLFLRRLDDLHTLEENKSARLKRPMERRVFPEGNDGIGKPEALKHDFAGYWSRRITDEHRLVYKIAGDEVRIAACRYHYG